MPETTTIRTMCPMNCHPTLCGMKVTVTSDKLVKVEGLGGGGASFGAELDQRSSARADALAALEALGLSRAAAERNLRKVLRADPGIQSAEELIRLALREN